MFRFLAFLLFFVSTLVGFSQDIKQINQIEPVYQQLDTMPQFIWGADSLQSLIKATQREVKDKDGQKITGMVAINFVVTKAGLIEQIQVYRSQDERLDAEALNVISNIRDFNPGIKDGKPVNTRLKSVLHFK